MRQPSNNITSIGLDFADGVCSFIKTLAEAGNFDRIANQPALSLARQSQQGIRPWS